MPQHQAKTSFGARHTPIPPARVPEATSPLTRHLREERFAQSQPPAPQALPQEVPHYQRNTQPLNPRAATVMSQQRLRESEIQERVHQALPVTTPSQQRPKRLSLKV